MLPVDWRQDADDSRSISATDPVTDRPVFIGYATKGSEGDAFARRICACVNSLAGVPTSALEVGAVGKLLEAARMASESLDRLYWTKGGRKEDHAALKALASAIALCEGKDG